MLYTADVFILCCVDRPGLMFVSSVTINGSQDDRPDLSFSICSIKVPYAEANKINWSMKLVFAKLKLNKPMELKLVSYSAIEEFLWVLALFNVS